MQLFKTGNHRIELRIQKNMLEELLRIFMGPVSDTFEMMFHSLGSRNSVWNRPAERSCSMDRRVISINFTGRRASGTRMRMTHPALFARGQLPWSSLLGEAHAIISLQLFSTPVNRNVTISFFTRHTSTSFESWSFFNVFSQV